MRKQSADPRFGQEPAQASRLALIRDVMGYGGDRQVSEWTRHSGFKQSAWNQWEKSAFKMSERMVDRLCAFVGDGLTHDYISRGLLGNMSYSLATKLSSRLDAHGLESVGHAHVLISTGGRK